MGFAPQPGRSHALSERRNAVFRRKMPGVGFVKTGTSIAIRLSGRRPGG